MGVDIYTSLLPNFLGGKDMIQFVLGLLAGGALSFIMGCCLSAANEYDEVSGCEEQAHEENK